MISHSIWKVVLSSFNFLRRVSSSSSFSAFSCHFSIFYFSHIIFWHSDFDKDIRKSMKVHICKGGNQKIWIRWFVFDSYSVYVYCNMIYRYINMIVVEINLALLNIVPFINRSMWKGCIDIIFQFNSND